MGFEENWFLGGLNADDRARLEPHLTPVEFELGQVLCDPGQEIENVWFFRVGMSSDVYVLEDGFEVEACGFGHESAFGLGAASGPARSFTRNLCQVPGDGWRLPAKAFRRAMVESDTLGTLVLKHVEASIGFMARSIACNARHDLQQRLSRWLLTAADHAPSVKAVETTHEFLGIMTGVQRTSVTGELGELQNQGVVELGRGRVVIKDRARLERTACECYRASQEAWAALRPGSRQTVSGV